MRKVLLLIAAMLILSVAACERSRNNTSWSTDHPDSTSTTKTDSSQGT